MRLFHVDPEPGIHAWARVRSGHINGSLPVTRPNDVAVEALTWHGARYVSYFDVLDDATWAPYHARGVAERNDLIFTRAFRDAHHFACSGEQFVGTQGEVPGDYVTLR